jgi:hypothetical protein
MLLLLWFYCVRTRTAPQFTRSAAAGQCLLTNGLRIPKAVTVDKREALMYGK